MLLSFMHPFLVKFYSLFQYSFITTNFYVYPFMYANNYVLEKFHSTFHSLGTSISNKKWSFTFCFSSYKHADYVSQHLLNKLSK